MLFLDRKKLDVLSWEQANCITFHELNNIYKKTRSFTRPFTINKTSKRNLLTTDWVVRCSTCLWTDRIGHLLHILPRRQLRSEGHNLIKRAFDGLLTGHSVSVGPRMSRSFLGKCSFKQQRDRYSNQSFVPKQEGHSKIWPFVYLRGMVAV